MKDKPLFEAVVCSRCCGTGNYSFNMVHGTTCYGCSGAGWKLTKRGAAAQAYLNHLREVPVSEIKVGDLIRVNIGMMSNKYVFSTVESIEYKTLYELGYRNPDSETSYGYRIITKRIDMVVFPNTRIRKGFSEAEKLAQRQQALDYQATLTATGKPSKKKAK